jgi:uncharacterized coiled-coil DUF342 family protein
VPEMPKKDEILK